LILLHASRRVLVACRLATLHRRSRARSGERHEAGPPADAARLAAC